MFEILVSGSNPALAILSASTLSFFTFLILEFLLELVTGGFKMLTSKPTSKKSRRAGNDKRL